MHPAIHQSPQEATLEVEVVRTVGSLTADDIGRWASLGVIPCDMGCTADPCRHEREPVAGTITRIQHESGLDRQLKTWIGLAGAHGWRYFAAHAATRQVVVS